MNPKPRPSHREYLEVLRRMTPEQRLAKAFELSHSTKENFLRGLQDTFPWLTAQDATDVWLMILEKKTRHERGMA